MNKMEVNNAADGSLVKQCYNVEEFLLDSMTKQSRGWHIRDTEVVLGDPSISSLSYEKRKRMRW